MNWMKQAMPQTMVHFADIGLDSNKQYIVFEFWNKQYLGVVKNSLKVEELPASDIHTYWNIVFEKK